MQLIKVTITRQEVESIKVYFIPYIGMLCSTAINNSQHDDNLNLKELIINSIWEDIEIQIDDVLSISRKEYELHFNRPQAITVICFFKQLPINVSQQYLNDLKDRIIDELEKQLWE